MTNEEIAAREAAAWCAGRDAAAKLAHNQRSYSVAEIINAIRALTPPADAQAALDAVVREAREEGYMIGFADGYEDGEKAARPDVAALLSGQAVAVPREATRAMMNAGLGAYINWRAAKEAECLDDREVAGIWKDMLTASPYAQEAARDEQS